MAPAVSIVLPTFNRTSYLRCAVDSVHAQTFRDWEMIIADDGSGEETRAYLRGLADDSRVRVLSLAHCGNPSLVRNRAIAAAEGRYLAFLDSDDLWAPAKLERQLAAMAARPGVLWSYTGFDHVDDQGKATTVDALDRSRLLDRLLDGWVLEPLLTLDLCIPMPTVIAARDLVNDIGGFDERQRFGEFHDLCVRLAARSPVVTVAEPLCSIRRHAEHYSGDRLAAVESWVALHGKLADLAPSARVRARCLRRRAEESLKLAGLRANRRDLAGVWATLVSAAPFSWRYPAWWLGAIKKVAQALAPDAVVSAYRRRGRIRAT